MRQSSLLDSVVRTRDVAGFRLSENLYARNTSVPRHAHNESVLWIALQGNCNEIHAGKVREHETFTISFLPELWSWSVSGTAQMTLTARLIFLALLLNLWSSTPTAAQGPSTLPADKIAKIEAAISAHASRLSIPGISVALVVDNQLRWQGSYGTADLENFVPAKPFTGLHL